MNFSERTLRTKRTLMVVSSIAIVIVWNDFSPSEISFLGTKLDISQLPIRFILGFSVTYLLLLFGAWYWKDTFTHREKHHEQATSYVENLQRTMTSEFKNPGEKILYEDSKIGQLTDIQLDRLDEMNKASSRIMSEAKSLGGKISFQAPLLGGSLFVLELVAPCILGFTSLYFLMFL